MDSIRNGHLEEVNEEGVDIFMFLIKGSHGGRSGHLGEVNEEEWTSGRGHRGRSGHLEEVNEEGVDSWDRPMRKEMTSGRGRRGRSGHPGEDNLLVVPLKYAPCAQFSITFTQQ